MSEDNKDTSASSGDSLTNVKAEFNRKLSNFETKIGSLESTNAQLLAAIQSMAKPAAPAASSKKIEDVWFDKPTEAAEAIMSQTEERIMKKIDSRSDQLHKQNQTLNQLVAEFPELANGEHELTKKAVEIYSAMSPEDKTSPLAYKAAVKEAALDLGVKPKSKRESYDDDFSLGGSGSNSARTESRGQSRTGLDKATIEFARLVGLNTEDPKVKDRLKTRSNRKIYNRWE